MSDLPKFIRENWPLRSGMGPVTTYQRTGLHKAADEIEALQKRCGGAHSRGQNEAFDRVLNHLNTIDTSGMSPNQVRRHIYGEVAAMKPRQALSPNKDMDDE